jgi:hypothetical protein
VTLALVIDGAQVVGIGVLSFLAGWLAADLFLPRGAAREGGEQRRPRPQCQSEGRGDGKAGWAWQGAAGLGMARPGVARLAGPSQGRQRRSGDRRMTRSG